MTNKVALIVDDSKLAQFVLRKMLREHALAVDSVESAEEAMSYLSEKKPDVIFMDHTMPGMDGLQAVKTIKENPQTASIPIMMYTSKSDGVFVNQARKLGAFDVLPKELKSIELEKVLDRLQLTNKDTNIKSAAAVDNNIAEPIPAMGSASDINEVSQLVKDAEAAFEKETLKQFVQQEFHKQQLVLNEKFDYISQNLDYIRTQSQEESDARRFNFNNFFWPLFALFVLSFLGFMYYQQSQTIDEIRASYQNSLSSINQKVIASVKGGQKELGHQRGRDARQHARDIINAVIAVVNSDNTVAYGDVFLDQSVSSKLESMLLPLSQTGLGGAIEIAVHTGNFCLSSNSAGGLILPEKNSALGSCQVFDPIIEGDRLLTAEFRDVLEGINNAEDGLTVSIISVGSDQPQHAYPDGNNVSADDWNQVAQKNNRVEFAFRPFEN